MAKKKETQPIYLVRKGDSLVPQLDMDRDKIRAIPQGGTIILPELPNPRHSPRHRAYWATLNECVKATGCAPNASVLHEAVKLGTGHVELVRLSGGLTVAVPGSIAFHKMTEDEMVTFFECAVEYLAREHGFVCQSELNTGAPSSRAPGMSDAHNSSSGLGASDTASGGPPAVSAAARPSGDTR